MVRLSFLFKFFGLKSLNSKLRKKAEYLKKKKVILNGKKVTREERFAGRKCCNKKIYIIHFLSKEKREKHLKKNIRVFFLQFNFRESAS